MTNQELNRDIKRLYKEFLNKRGGDTTNWSNQDWNEYTAKEDAFKKEFHRLYHADKNFEVVNKQGILMMIVLNNSLRVIPFHVFGAIKII